MKIATIATALMLAATPAFAGGHGHGGHGGGHASAKADRQAAKAERRAEKQAAKAERKADRQAAKAAAVTISPGTWHATQAYSDPAAAPPGNPQQSGDFTMQPNGRFAYSGLGAPSIKGKVNAKTAAVKGRGYGGVKIRGTYYDPLDGPDDTDRATMAGSILGKHGVTLGTWFAGGPELTEP